MSDLGGRTVVITGGNGGIGLGMARSLGQAGARVILWGRSEAKNEDAISSLRDAGVTALAFVCDVTDETAVEEAFAASVDAAGGHVDSAFANAGRGGTGTSCVDTSLEQWRSVMATNLDGVFLTLRAAARHMVDHGGGSLVAVSSTSAIHGAG